jgi:hypothetical protein
MKRLDQNRQDAFARALQYNTDHALAPAVPRATALFTELGGIKTGMLADAATQATGFTAFRGGTDERGEAFDGLLDEMRVLNRIARGLNKTEFPELREQFRMPRSRSFAGITAQARAFATNAAAQEAVFTDRGLPAGFVAAFTTKVDAAEEAVEARNTGLINRAGATAGLKAKGRRGVEILRELDGIMGVALRNNPVLFGAWKVARRIASPARAAAEPPAAGGGGGSTPPPSGS